MNDFAEIERYFQETAPDDPPAKQVTSFRHKDLDLVRDEKERPIWNVANALTVLSEHPDWAEALAFDELSARTMLLRPMPGSPAANFQPREIADTDFTDAAAWFNRNGFPRATKNVLADALVAVAARSIISPVRHYLEALQWDGSPRIGTWLSNYCAADLDTYTAEAGKRWLISAVARALQPGCKADAMLILEGHQGGGKSSGLRALAGEQWFSDSLPDMGTKDASDHLRGKWIVEIAELTATRRAEVEQVKAFLSRQEERYRPAYGRNEIAVPRRCVFVGTTNQDDYLRDETGNRRFWPVAVGTIDRDALARDRDQIWAEAVAAYRSGEIWWLTGEAEALAVEAQAARQEADVWEQSIADYVASRDEVCVKEILRDLGFDTKDMPRPEQRRVGALLRRAGFQRLPKDKFTSGTWKGCARFTRVAK